MPTKKTIREFAKGLAPDSQKPRVQWADWDIFNPKKDEIPECSVYTVFNHNDWKVVIEIQFRDENIRVFAYLYPTSDSALDPLMTMGPFFADWKTFEVEPEETGKKIRNQLSQELEALATNLKNISHLYKKDVA